MGFTPRKAEQPLQGMELHPANYFLTTSIQAVLWSETRNNEEIRSNHQAYYPNVPFLHDEGYKTNKIIKYFSKETRKWIYLSKTCYHIIFP